MSPRIETGLETLRAFLVERLYQAPPIRDAFARARQVLERLWAFYLEHPDTLPPDSPGSDALPRRVCDFIAGMTDQYALAQFERHLMPHPWAEED
jgi:dGTPase